MLLSGGSLTKSVYLQVASALLATLKRVTCVCVQNSVTKTLVPSPQRLASVELILSVSFTTQPLKSVSSSSMVVAMAILTTLVLSSSVNPPARVCEYVCMWMVSDNSR